MISNGTCIKFSVNRAFSDHETDTQRGNEEYQSQRQEIKSIGLELAGIIIVVTSW